MKATALLIFLFAGIVIADNYDLTNENFEEIALTEDILPAESWNDIKELVLSTGELKAGFIQADITEYVQKLLENVQKFIVNKGLEPLLIGDQKLKLFPGSLTLTKGKVLNLSSINLSGKVIVKYNQNENLIDLIAPLGFKSLTIHYDYKAQITILSFKGGVDAKVKNVKLNLHLGFNFTNYHAFVDKADIRDSGSITLDFSGGIADKIIEILAKAITTIFRGLILNIVNIFVDAPVEGLVNTVNDLIDSILLRNNTATNSTLLY